MEKEFEALERLYKCNEDDYTLGYQRRDYKLLQETLQRLEAIDNANISEALEGLKHIKKYYVPQPCSAKTYDYLEIIERALLKVQETENENAYIKKIKTMMKQKECVLRYIESEDCFAVKTILSDGWYKLTPEFVENNVREEIKPLPLIEKNNQLREENAELKRVLEIVKKIVTETEDRLQDILRTKNYEEYKKLWYRNNQWYFKEIDLTEEEFYTIKKYFSLVVNLVKE